MGYPHSPDDPEPLPTDPEVAAVAWDILQALHSNVPEADRPQSWSDMDQDQEARIRAAAVAAIERMRPHKLSEDSYWDAATDEDRHAVFMDALREAEKYNGWHQLVCLENERLRNERDALAHQLQELGHQP